MRRKDGVYRTYHYDFRGSTVALTDDSGVVTDRYSYGPYGELLSHTGPNDTPFLYNGRDGVKTDNNGLYYMRSRYYNPEIKRFLSEDTFEGKYDELLNINLFEYANNNPVMNVDPTGNYSVAFYFIPGIGQYFLGATVIAGLTYVGYKAGVYLGDKAKVYFAKKSSGKKAKDAGKNDPHGDNGRALDKAKGQIEELEKKLKDAKSSKEKRDILQKIKNIRKAAERAKKGETHWR